MCLLVVGAEETGRWWGGRFLGCLVCERHGVAGCRLWGGGVRREVIISGRSGEVGVSSGFKRNH